MRTASETVLLSATIGNAKQFASWIEEVRGVRCGVIGRPGARPVPLRSAMLLPDRRLIPLIDERGGLNPEIVALGQRAREERRGSDHGYRRRRFRQD